MKCVTCHKELDKTFFLACPEKLEPHAECVFCMRDRYCVIANFLKDAADFDKPNNYINFVGEAKKNSVRSITCVEKHLSDIENLKEELFSWQAKTHQQQRLHNHLKLQLRCAAENDCSFRATAIEKDNGQFVLQIMHTHDCNANLTNDIIETREFIELVKRLESCLSQKHLHEVQNLSQEYLDVSNVYKKIQEELHNLEDKAIKEVWGMPCRWRRARGETNRPPQKQDLERLHDIVKQRGYGKAVEDYVSNNFHTSIESTYYQQRGYFLLLTCAPQEILRNLIESRLKVMVYARNLLRNNMFFICYKRLNCTVLRNHAWMMILLLQALCFLRGFGEFPLMGISEPKDSQASDFYNVLKGFDADFYQQVRL